MSTEKHKIIGSGVPFGDVWERIIESTDIESLTDIGKIVGKKQQTISASKQNNIFPYGWAYLIAKKYNLLTEWLLTGKGPKRLSDVGKTSQRKFEILDEIEEWLEEIQEQNPDVDRNVWFAAEMIDNFKSYRERKLRKDTEKEEEYSATSYKVA